MSLNAKTIKAVSNKRVQQDELPIGNYLCRIAQVIDLGVRPREKWDTTTNSYVIDTEKAPAQFMMVTYEFGTEFVKDKDGVPDEAKPRWLSETIPLFNLEVDLATSTKRYKAIDPQNSAEGDWTRLVNAPCMVMIAHKASGKAKIGAVTSAIAGVPFPELKNAPKTFVMDAPDMEVFGSLPEWVQEKITTALNFADTALAGKLGGRKESSPEPTATEGSSTTSKPEPKTTAAELPDVKQEESPW